jgi:hypothetical protein
LFDNSLSNWLGLAQFKGYDSNNLYSRNYSLVNILDKFILKKTNNYYNYVKDLGQYLDDGIDKRLNNNFNKILNLVSNKNFSGGDLINLLRDRSLEKNKKNK